MDKDSIAFIVFYRDVGSDLQETLDSISLAIKSSINWQFEIIIVDDGSRLENSFQFDKSLIFNFHSVRHPRSLGISEAIKTGLALSTSKWILPVPGHAMYGSQAIQNILSLCSKGDVILGCRTNLARSRPPVKRLASRILRDLYRHLTFYYIGDIHGLFLARRTDFERYMPKAKGHGNAIAVITNVVASGGLLIQTAAPVQEGHDNRSSKKFTDNLPSFKAILTAVSALWEARKIYRKGQLNKINV
jgi:glycosyltransferase involved in cell wall biosynthesis